MHKHVIKPHEHNEIISHEGRDSQISICQVISIIVHLSVLLVCLYWNVKDDQSEFLAPVFNYSDALRQFHYSGQLPMSILFVITSCHEKNPLNRTALTTRFNAGYITLHCNPETNRFDCRESAPMINFVIDNYQTRVARRFVFLHDHESSWHYTTNLYDRLEYLQKTDYWKRDFGGIYESPYATDYLPWFDGVYTHIFAGVSDMPAKKGVGTGPRPCCATFFVNPQLIWRRAREEYQSVITNMRLWSHSFLDANPKLEPDVQCSRVTEHSWFALFAGANGSIARPPL